MIAAKVSVGQNLIQIGALLAHTLTAYDVNLGFANMPLIIDGRDGDGGSPHGCRHKCTKSAVLHQSSSLAVNKDPRDRAVMDHIAQNFSRWLLAHNGAIAWDNNRWRDSGLTHLNALAR